MSTPCISPVFLALFHGGAMTLIGTRPRQVPQVLVRGRARARHDLSHHASFMLKACIAFSSIMKPQLRNLQALFVANPADPVDHPIFLRNPP